MKRLVNAVRHFFAHWMQAVSREPILWFDCDGILRDMDGRPIKQVSVSNERIREAWARRHT